jgi:hypothetical protein
MNKSVNILLILLLIPVFGLSIFVGFDLPIEFLKTSGKNLPYQHVIFITFGILIFLLGVRRSMQRWVGIKMVNNLEKYQWNEEIDAKRKSQINMYLMIEGIMHLLVGFALVALTQKVLVIATVFFALGIDHLLFCLVGNFKKVWRVGVTNKAIVVAERDFKVIYFSGLRRVTVHQQTLFFDYIKELQLAISIDSISPKNRTSFRNVLEEKLNRDKVHFSETFKEF